MPGRNIDENDTLWDKSHSVQHAATSTADHTFPAGTANYLRADGSWAAPPTGGGTPSGTVVAETAYAAGSTAGTSAEYSRGDHTHGSPADLVTGTAHASLTTVHSLGTMAQAASAAYTGTATYTAHTATDASHGAGTIASIAAITSQITTHASSTDPHSVYTLKTAYTAKGTLLAGSAASLPTALAIGGTASYVLMVDATAVTGMKWGAAPAGTPSGTVVSETAASQALTAGISSEYSRGDHTHGTPAGGGAGILSTVVKAGTQAFSTTALANVSSLTFACASTTLYHYKFIPMIKSGTITVGVKFSVTYPSSTIAAGRVSIIVAATGVSSEFVGQLSSSGTAIASSSVIAAGTISMAIIEGMVKATAAGSIQLQAAAEAAGTIWIMDGSVGLLYTIL